MKGLLKYKSLPADPHRSSPLDAWGHTHSHLVGGYWTVPVDVPLGDLSTLRAVVQSRARLGSVKSARLSGVELPPIEIGVFRDGSGWIVDGNHRLAEARKARLASVPVVFTFVGAS